MELLLILGLLGLFVTVYFIVLWFCIPLVAHLIATSVNHMLQIGHATPHDVASLIWASVWISLMLGWPAIFNTGRSD